MVMHRVSRVASPVPIVLLLIACTATPGASPTPGPTANPTPTLTPSSPPNANVAVIRIEQTGGMMPPWETMRWYPTVALYGDGRLITPGPELGLYPGPALPNVTMVRFSRDGVEQALAWAAEAGLQGPDRQLGPMILDAGELVFSVVGPNGTHRTSVTALSADDPQIGALRQFQDVISNLAAWLPEDVTSQPGPYPWDRLRVVSFPADPANMPDPDRAQVVDWPLADLASLGVSWSEPAQYRCFELTGDDLAVVRPIFESANELTLYRAADVDYQLYLHPLLPDDEACPGF